MRRQGRLVRSACVHDSAWLGAAPMWLHPARGVPAWAAAQLVSREYPWR